MSYTSWRISFQDGEQAARVAYHLMVSCCDTLDRCEAQIESLEQDIVRLNALVRYYEDLHSKLLEG